MRNLAMPAKRGISAQVELPGSLVQLGPSTTLHTGLTLTSIALLVPGESTESKRGKKMKPLDVCYANQDSIAQGVIKLTRVKQERITI
jgi:hypothetical protein